MRRLRDEWQVKADALIDSLLARGTFDAIADLANVFPLRVFPDAVGPAPEGRENLLPYGNMVFNAIGPRNQIFLDSIKEAEPVLNWIYDQCRREALTPGGFGSQVFEALDRGEIEPEDAPLLVRSMLTVGLDTTIIGIGMAVYAFALFPTEWEKLRADPALVCPAFDEIVRWSIPVQAFFRTTTREVQVGETTIPGGAKVLMFFGSANRDPRRWSNADVVDISRDTTGHVGFGVGIHGCVGQMVARMEADVVLTAMLKRVKTIEIVGEPVRHLNNALHSLDSLPIRVTAA